MRVIFSDLDGALLDPHNYSFAEASEALHSIQSAGIPLVICTSRTSAQIELFRGQLPCHPVIIENGGAILIPSGYFPFSIPGTQQRNRFEAIKLGDCREHAIVALRHASEKCGVPVRGFSELTTTEICELTGFNADEAERANAREFDEPFISLDPERTPELLCALEQTGKRWTRGTHFYHAFGPSDKASAAWMLLKFYERAFGDVESIGLGDAPSDIDFMQLMKRCVIVRSEFSPMLQKALPQAELAAWPGPRGWSDSIGGFLNGAKTRVAGAKVYACSCASISNRSSYGRDLENAGSHFEEYNDEHDFEEWCSGPSAAGFRAPSPVLHD
ncbi:MAG TPA: HAD-IIB family hydrolase [Bryobacteraceae bacterium]|nr:HAD-IIB family hydrolase [Bryobacteraceae bacterium]